MTAVFGAGSPGWKHSYKQARHDEGIMGNVIEEIEAEIAGVKTATIRKSIGVIREIGDGVARVEGLGDVMLNEMLDLGQGITGLALSLDETEVGVIILGDYT